MIVVVGSFFPSIIEQTAAHFEKHFFFKWAASKRKKLIKKKKWGQLSN